MTEFEEYKKVGEPSVREKAQNWGIAIGLQQVDGLTPSKYLYQIARENIEGKISIGEVYKKLDAYHRSNTGMAGDSDKIEADSVSARISEILADKSFSFAPTTLFAIHDKLFREVYPDLAGKIRKYDITKKEKVLGGDTVLYGTAVSIMETLKYDFDNEKKFDYSGLTNREKSEHIAKFISAIWQTHPFGEGNTRTIAVFIIKYLRAMGFSGVGNDMFEKHAKYFRNALVRANYQNMPKNVFYSSVYLNKFFGNMLLGENNDFKNSDMQINIANSDNKVSDIISDKIGKTEKAFLQSIMNYLETHGEIGNEQAREITQKSPQRVRQLFSALVSAGILIATGDNKARKYKLNT